MHKHASLVTLQIFLSSFLAHAFIHFMSFCCLPIPSTENFSSVLNLCETFACLLSIPATFRRICIHPSKPADAKMSHCGGRWADAFQPITEQTTYFQNLNSTIERRSRILLLSNRTWFCETRKNVVRHHEHNNHNIVWPCVCVRLWTLLTHTNVRKLKYTRILSTTATTNTNAALTVIRSHYFQFPKYLSSGESSWDRTNMLLLAHVRT